MFEFEKIVVFICDLLKKNRWKKFEKIRTNSKKFEKLLDWKFEIRFEGKMIRFVRFEKFSIPLIRKYIFNSKNSRKINSKFVLFNSTPHLVEKVEKRLDVYNILECVYIIEWICLMYLKCCYSLFNEQFCKTSDSVYNVQC